MWLPVTHFLWQMKNLICRFWGVRYIQWRPTSSFSVAPMGLPNVQVVHGPWRSRDLVLHHIGGLGILTNSGSAGPWRHVPQIFCSYVLTLAVGALTSVELSKRARPVSPINSTPHLRLLSRLCGSPSVSGSSPEGLPCSPLLPQQNPHKILSRERTQKQWM